MPLQFVVMSGTIQTTKEMKVIPHATIKEGDIVEYDEENYKVTKVWNHGYSQWWFDLKAIEPKIKGLDFYPIQLSVPDYELKLKK